MFKVLLSAKSLWITSVLLGCISYLIYLDYFERICPYYFYIKDKTYFVVVLIEDLQLLFIRVVVINIVIITIVIVDLDIFLLILINYYIIL